MTRTPRFPNRASLPTVLLASLLAPAALAQVTVDVPPEDIGIATIEARRAAQESAAKGWGVVHDFRFTDRRSDSGITFVNAVVEDAARHWKPVHYDHGNGVAAADVDGDGRLDLYFTNQIGGNELWRNLGSGRFENVTERAGVAVDDRISVAAAFADIDNDGDPDLYVTTVRMGNVLFENLGGGRFRDITAEAGVGHVGHSSGIVFLDYNRDGRLDLFLVNVGRYTSDRRGKGGYHLGLPDAFFGHLYPERAERSILYENRGGNRFANVSEQVGLIDESWSGDAVATDFDGDGYPGLYVASMQGDDHYWHNQGGARFEDRTTATFPKTPWGAMGVELLDFDQDGDLDLYVTDMHSDMAEEVLPEREKAKSTPAEADQHYADHDNNILGNAFYENLGDGKFREISDAIGAENYWPWGPSAGDLNADGWEDLFVASSMNYPFRYALNSVLLNDRGEGFRDAELVLGVEPRADGRFRKPWFELDCDALDLGHAQCAGQRGKVIVNGTLGSRSAVLLDLDGDSDLDIVTLEFNAEPQVLTSNLSEVRGVNALEIALRGTASNRDGLGALVQVKVGERTLTQYHNGKSGYLAQSSMPLYFGLGAAQRADQVEVRWPSGRRQTVPGPIKAGQRLEVVEPAE